MADWSWANLKGKFGDIANDPGSLTANPMFTGGMGLLSASRDGTVDPFQAFTQGLQSGKTEKQSQEDRKRIEDLREKLGALIAQQIQMQQAQQGQQIDPATGRPLPPQAQAQGMSPIPPGAPGAQAIPPNLIQQLMQSQQR